MATYYETWLEELRKNSLMPPESIEERCWEFFKWMCKNNPNEFYNHRQVQSPEFPDFKEAEK